jgi:hypothetical protein
VTRGAQPLITTSLRQDVEIDATHVIC